MDGLTALIKTRIKHLVKIYLPASLKVRYLLSVNPPRYPQHVFIEPTTRCNINCVYCGRSYWKSRDPKRDLSFDLYKKILRQLVEKGVKGITLQGGGEPLLHRDIFEMIVLARSLGLFTRFNTNLTSLTEEEAERLVRSGHSAIDLSIDTVDPALFADLRRGTTLEHVLGNLRKISEAKKRLGSDHPQIHANAVLTKASLQGLSELIAEMKKAGVTRMNLADMNTDGVDLNVVLRDGSRLGDNLLSRMPEGDVVQALAEVRRLASKEFEICMPGDLVGRKGVAKRPPGVITCAELWERPFIDSAGRMTPCCWLPDGDIITLGDFNTQSFDEIWFGERYELLRRQHLTNRHPLNCARCQQLMYVVAAPSRLRAAPEPVKEYAQVFVGKGPKDIVRDSTAGG